METAGGCGTGIVGGVAVEGGRRGVNIVMISPEFPSSGPLKRGRRREKREERAAAVLSPTATLTMATPPSSRERGTLRENRNPDTHTHTLNILRGPVDTSHSPIKVLTWRGAVSSPFIISKAPIFHSFIKNKQKSMSVCVCV